MEGFRGYTSEVVGLVGSLLHAVRRLQEHQQEIRGSEVEGSTQTHEPQQRSGELDLSSRPERSVVEGPAVRPSPKQTFAQTHLP